MTDASPGVPPGFVKFDQFSGYTDVNGPFYARRDGDRLIFGFRVEPRHANLVGQCHGGMLLLFADTMLPLSARFQADLGSVFLPTVSLSSDFVASAKVGDWVEGRTEVIRATRNLVFTQGIISANGETLTRINGIFKRGAVMPEIGERVNLERMFGTPGSGTPGAA